MSADPRVRQLCNSESDSNKLEGASAGGSPKAMSLGDFSTVMYSEALTDDPVEGAQVVAGQLASHLTEVHGASVFSPTGEVGTRKGKSRFIPEMPFKALRKVHTSHFVYLPESGLTYGALLRTFALWVLGNRPKVDVVVLMVHFTPRPYMRKVVPNSWSFVAGTPKQADSLSMLSPNVRYLQPRVPEARIATHISQSEARDMCELPQGRIYLHVGHARQGRNLHALEPLAKTGIVVVIVSPLYEEEAGTIPNDKNIRIIRGAVSNMGAFYRSANVYVFPTFLEANVIGLPMSVFESLANGTPVVARRSPALIRWEHLPGLHLVDSDAELGRVAAKVGMEQTPESRQLQQSLLSCKEDLTVCLTEVPQEPQG
jgi:hypothetical protein